MFDFQSGSTDLDHYPLPKSPTDTPTKLNRNNYVKHEDPRLSALLRPLVLPSSHPSTLRSNRVQKRSTPVTPLSHRPGHDLQQARRQQLLDAAILQDRHSERDFSAQLGTWNPRTTAASVAYARYHEARHARISSGLSMSSDGWSFTLEAPEGRRGYWTTRMIGPFNVQVVFEVAIANEKEADVDPYGTVDAANDAKVQDQYMSVEGDGASDGVSSDVS